MALTYSDLIEYFPGVASTDAGRQAQIDRYLVRAESQLQGVIGTGLLPSTSLEEQAQMLLAMHLLKRIDRGDNLGSGGVGGLGSQSLDAVVQSYATASPSDGYWSWRGTVYGSDLADLLLTTMDAGPVLL